jgi:hypothetical protein
MARVWLYRFMQGCLTGSCVETDTDGELRWRAQKRSDYLLISTLVVFGSAVLIVSAMIATALFMHVGSW